MDAMSRQRTPLFVRLPQGQAAALDRLSEATGRLKQSLVSELLGDRLSVRHPLSIGRVEVARSPLGADEVLSLEEVAKLLKVAPDAVRSRAEQGELPGRRFGKEWRFSRIAVLAWLANGESHARGGIRVKSRAIDV